MSEHIMVTAQSILDPDSILRCIQMEKDLGNGVHLKFRGISSIMKIYETRLASERVDSGYKVMRYFRTHKQSESKALIRCLMSRVRNMTDPSQIAALCSSAPREFPGDILQAPLMAAILEKASSSDLGCCVSHAVANKSFIEDLDLQRAYSEKLKGYRILSSLLSNAPKGRKAFDMVLTWIPNTDTNNSWLQHDAISTLLKTGGVYKIENGRLVIEPPTEDYL